MTAYYTPENGETCVSRDFQRDDHSVCCSGNWKEEAVFPRGLERGGFCGLQGCHDLKQHDSHVTCGFLLSRGIGYWEPPPRGSHDAKPPQRGFGGP